MARTLVSAASRLVSKLAGRSPINGQALGAQVAEIMRFAKGPLVKRQERLERLLHRLLTVRVSSCRNWSGVIEQLAFTNDGRRQ